jgi:hypothetical protein
LRNGEETIGPGGIFDDEPEAAPAPAPELTQSAPTPAARSRPKRAVEGRGAHRRRAGAAQQPPRQKPVLIHIPEDMHRTLRQLSVEEGGEPLTVITERLLRQYLVQRGHTRFAP